MVQTTIAQKFLPEEFTLSELQRVLLTVRDDAKISADSLFLQKPQSSRSWRKYWMKRAYRRKLNVIHFGLHNFTDLMQRLSWTLFIIRRNE